MKSVPEMEKLIQALRRGSLTAEQEAQVERFLASHPDQRAEVEQELVLNHLLRSLPDAPVSSNFNARVLQAARQSLRPAPRPGLVWRRLLFGQWIPKAVLATVVLSAGLITYQQHRVSERRELAHGLEQLSQLAAETPLEVLENFEAIQRLNQVSHDTDRELIAALQ